MRSAERSNQDAGSCLRLLSGACDTLMGAEQRVAQFLVRNGAAAARMSIRELAEKTECCPATVIRLCKAIGYSGYAELRFRLRESGNTCPDDLVVSPKEALSSVKHTAIQYTLRAVTDTIENCNDEALDAAAAAVLRAGTVLLSATGSAAGIAMASCSQLLSFGINAQYPQDSLMQLRAAATLKKGDVVIGINYDGYAKTVADAFLVARRQGATTILISSSTHGLLARYADVLLYTPQHKHSNSLNFSTTSICQVIAVQLILLRMWQSDPERLGTASEIMRSYTKMKRYSPGTETIGIDFASQRSSG